jgi:hypothetical protein
LVKLAVGTTSAASTPSLSTTISTTFEEISDIIKNFKRLKIFSVMRNETTGKLTSPKLNQCKSKTFSINIAYSLRFFLYLR